MRKDSLRTHNYRVLEPTASPDQHDDHPDDRRTTEQKTHPRHTADARTRDRTPHKPRPRERSDRESPNPSALTHAHPDDEGVELLTHDGILLADGGTDSRYVVPTGDGYLATYTVGDDRKLTIGTAGLGAWTRDHRVHAIDHEDGVVLRAGPVDTDVLASYRVSRRYHRARVCVGPDVLSVLKVTAGDDVRVYDLESNGFLLVSADDDPRIVTDGGCEYEPHVSAQTTTRTRLATIDEQTGTLLDSLEIDDDLDTQERRTAWRHLREIRARVESLSVVFRCPDVVTRRLDRDDDLEDQPGEHRGATDDTTLPMIRHRGRSTTTDLGPDPIAFEREYNSQGDRNERSDGER